MLLHGLIVFQRIFFLSFMINYCRYSLDFYSCVKVFKLTEYASFKLVINYNENETAANEREGKQNTTKRDPDSRDFKTSRLDLDARAMKQENRGLVFLKHLVLVRAARSFDPTLPNSFGSILLTDATRVTQNEYKAHEKDSEMD